MGLFDDDEDEDKGKKERSYTLKELKELAKIFRSPGKKAKKD